MAHRFTAQHATMKRGTKYNFHDGVLFRTKADKHAVTTDVLVLPVYALAVNITSRDTDEFINGHAAHVRNVDLAKLSRDAFYVKDADLTGGDETTEGIPAPIPEAFAFGAPMPAGTPSFQYCGFTGKQVEGYTTLRSTQSFDEFTTGAHAPGQVTPFVASSADFWVEAVVYAGWGQYRRFTFSEDWLRQFAPGHDLISRANRHRLCANFVGACSNGQRLAISVAMTDADPFDSVTNNYDTGVCNALTVCIDMDAEDGPEVVWTSLWDRRTENDPRVAAYRFWPEAPYDEDDYSSPPASGYGLNTVFSVLEMDEQGVVFGVRTITTSIKLPQYYTEPIEYDNEMSLLPVYGQQVRYVEWTTAGAYSDVLIAQGCEAGALFYNSVDTETQFPPGVQETVLEFLEAYDVHNTEVTPGQGSTTTICPTYGLCAGYEGDSRYVLVPVLNVIRDLMTGAEPEDLTGQRKINGANSTQYAVFKMQGGAYTFQTYQASGVGFESVVARTTSGALHGIDDNGLNPYINRYAHANLSAPRGAYIGGAGFATTAVDASITDAAYTVLGFLSFDGAGMKAIPGGYSQDETLGEESLRIIQEQLPNPDGPPTPCMLALTDDSGAYISNDGGDTWAKVVDGDRYADLAYIGNQYLVRPFNKEAPVR